MTVSELSHQTAAREVRTVWEASQLMMEIRPRRGASAQEWKNYFRFSAATYRKVAKTDPHHHDEALYWANREEANSRKAPPRPIDSRSKIAFLTTVPSTLEAAEEALERVRPHEGEHVTAWLAYYHRAAELYAEVAETDRGHHHEALACAGLARDKALSLAPPSKRPSS